MKLTAKQERVTEFIHEALVTKSLSTAAFYEQFYTIYITQMKSRHQNKQTDDVYLSLHVRIQSSSENNEQMKHSFSSIHIM